MQAKFQDVDKERQQPVEHPQAKPAKVAVVATRRAASAAAQPQPN